MKTTFIEFRGEEQEVEYRIGRYEYDTNGQEFEWWFLDKTIRPTAEEYALVDALVYDTASDPHNDDFDLEPFGY